MFIFNTTYLVPNEMCEMWFKWLKEDCIPSMLNSGCFHTPQVVKVLSNESPDGDSYSVQFRTESEELLEEWTEKYSEKFFEGFERIFGKKVLSFSSLLKEIEC